MVFVALSDRVKRDKPLESVLFPVVSQAILKKRPLRKGLAELEEKAFLGCHKTHIVRPKCFASEPFSEM